MKTLFQNWNLRRTFYLIGGIFFVLVAVNDRTWWMIPFGLYFVAMAVFQFGCASGNCEIPTEKNNSKST